MNLEKLFSFSPAHNKLILVYHGVVTTPNHAISVGPLSVKQFEEQLSYFKKNFNVVSQEEIFKMYREEYKPSKKTIALTFDDSYENNYTQAFPLLKKYNFPATMYVISQCIEDDYRLTWYDYVDLIKNNINFAKIDLSGLNKPNISTLAELRSLIKTLNISQRNILYKEFEKQVNVKDYLPAYPRENWKLMNKQQLKKLAESGLVEIGAHTHNHPNLGEINLDDARYEVTHCKQLLENVTQKETKSIAFPDGSYTDDVKKICLEVGYKNLLAVDYRCASDIDDKNILQRFGISATTTFESNIVRLQREFDKWGF